MELKLVAVHDDALYMYAEKNTNQLQEDDVCIVYNKDADQFAPKLCVGSWTARMNPWLIPTDEQIEESKQWESKLKSQMIM